MKKVIMIVSIILLIICGIFFAISPDYISMIVVGVMSLTVCLGYIFGILPNLMFSAGFINGIKNIDNLQKITADNKWIALKQMTPIFKQSTLDKYFERYLQITEEQRNKGLVVSDVEDIINEDSLSLQSWRTVVMQIASILTALGLLGTFLGLVTGISSVSFGTFDATVTSIETLLQGIATAFFTSIVGVVLSVIFNITNRVIWNYTLREMGLFYEKFHSHIQPLAEDQIRIKSFCQNEEIISLLTDLRNSESRSNYIIGESNSYEQRLMIQILSGIENGEFSVFYEPVCKIEDRSIEKAIGKIRWNHKTLGIIDLVSYESVIKANGFIIKLEKFVWENVAEHLSKLKEQSLRTVPVVLRASKQLVLSTDISQYISDLTQKYCLMPRDIEIAIEWNAYRDCYEMAKKSETSLLELGYNVIIDNFSGSSLQLPNTNAEEIIVDFKEIDENEFESFATQIGRKNINIIPTSVSFAKQITVIRKCGCKFACGSHLCPQISANDFTNMINQ